MIIFHRQEDIEAKLRAVFKANMTIEMRNSEGK